MARRIILFIAVVLLVIFIELSLTLSGKIYLIFRSADSSLSDKRVTKYICSIGDSHTFGVGTSYNYSYPKQLERLLNLNNPGIMFDVVNLGIPGDSTKHQVDRLVAFLDKNRADIVILLTGRNNQYEAEAWQNKSFTRNVILKVKQMKTFKFMAYIINRILKIEDKENIIPKRLEKYEDYMRCQLIRAKFLCKKNGCKLLLVSYYNSSNEYIERIAKEYGVLYFNLTQDFSRAVSGENRGSFISPDKSHMNSSGYKFYAEVLYTKMFLYNVELNLKLSPLFSKIDKLSFYRDAAEIKNALLAQEERIKNMPNDPFELVHLGHIYMEISQEDKAKECYLRAIELGGYMDNNTIVSPIINWYLEHGMHEEAYRICQKIILMNKDNNIAKSYLSHIAGKYNINANNY